MNVLEIVVEGVSIEQLRAYEIEEARSLQWAMIPTEPLCGERFQFASRFRPATTVGGDFLDYYHLSDGTVGFYVGDVVGKGLPAALYAALAVGTLRGIHKTGEEPVRVLELLNRRLRMRHIPKRYCSLQYGVFDPATRLLRFANAGLPLPIHISPEGCRALGGGGNPAGMFENPSYFAETVQLASGDAVLFFSDGLSEAHGPDGLDFGGERLDSICQNQRHASTEEILNAVFSALDEFVGSRPPHDDIAAAVLKVL